MEPQEPMQLKENREIEEQADKKTHKNEDLLKSLNQMTDNQLLNYVYYLDVKNRQLEGRIALLQPYKQRETRNPPEEKQNALFSKFKLKKYALKIAYIGVNYNGMAIQQSTDNTIQAYLFKCLYGLSLIRNKQPTSEYRRAGRTDKGVSAFGNVISLNLRTCEEIGPTQLKNDSQKDKRDGCLQYAKMLNAILPEDIRVLAYTQVNDGFDARKDCIERQYKYFFIKSYLDLEAMSNAIRRFEGTHNFVNFCKLDITSTLDYDKTIKKASIQRMQSDILGLQDNQRNHIYYFHFVGNSFLWHQIRYMAAILFLVGYHKEKPTIVDQLLDIQRYPSKPNYTAAPQHPLILQDCRYKNVQFKVHPNDAVNFYNTFNDIVVKNVIEMTLYANCIHLMKQWVEDCQQLPSNQMEQQATKIEKQDIQRRNRKLKMLKPSGLSVEQSINNLKGKSKELFQMVRHKKDEYDRLNK